MKPTLSLGITRLGRSTGIYRTLVMVCFALIGALLLRVLAQIDSASLMAWEVKNAVTGLVSRMDNAEKELERLRQSVYRRKEP